MGGFSYGNAEKIFSLGLCRKEGRCGSGHQEEIFLISYKFREGHRPSLWRNSMEYQFENIQQYDQKMYLEFLYKIPYRKALLWGEAWLLIAIKDIYPVLVQTMDRLRADEIESINDSGIIGVGWCSSGGEAAGLLKERYLAADGIENVINVIHNV